MLRNNERRDSISEIKSCEKFNFKITRNIKRFRRRIHAIYST